MPEGPVWVARQDVFAADCAMTGHPQYRQATVADLEGIGEVFVAAFPDSVSHYVRRPLSPRVMADGFGICLDAEPEAFFVATMDDNVAGYIFAPAHPPRVFSTAIRRGHLARMIWRWIRGEYGVGIRPALLTAGNLVHTWRGTTGSDLHSDAQIFSVAVHPDFHGQGIGTNLTRLGLDYLESSGAKRVRLEVRPDNSPAIHIYEKLGFHTKGHTRDTQGTWLIMLKDMHQEDGK